MSGAADTITGTAYTDSNESVYGMFISMQGILKSGGGGDTITGSATSSVDNEQVYGIFNEGKILTGAGEDQVDALIGGFGGNGVTNLGKDNDILLGFGTGSFKGGGGEDTILLGEGVYIFNEEEIIHESIKMSISGFELIGGFNSASERFSITSTDQNLSVDENGFAQLIS